jgi:hypothetical protein
VTPGSIRRAYFGGSSVGDRTDNGWQNAGA